MCGSDTNLYRNTCEMKKANCGKHVHQVFLYIDQVVSPPPIYDCKCDWFKLVILITIDSQQDKDLESLSLQIL